MRFRTEDIGNMTHHKFTTLISDHNYVDSAIPCCCCCCHVPAAGLCPGPGHRDPGLHRPGRRPSLCDDFVVVGFLSPATESLLDDAARAAAGENGGGVAAVSAAGAGLCILSQVSVVRRAARPPRNQVNKYTI